MILKEYRREQKKVCSHIHSFLPLSLPLPFPLSLPFSLPLPVPLSIFVSFPLSIPPPIPPYASSSSLPLPLPSLIPYASTLPLSLPLLSASPSFFTYNQWVHAMHIMQDAIRIAKAEAKCSRLYSALSKIMGSEYVEESLRQGPPTSKWTMELLQRSAVIWFAYGTAGLRMVRDIFNLKLPDEKFLLEFIKEQRAGSPFLETAYNILEKVGIPIS